MYQLNHLKGDIFGGITTAIVALPLALAFGVSSGAGALAGLYGAVFAGLFAALFGGTRTQVTGPTGPMTVVMAVVLTHFSDNIGAAFTVVVLAGIFQIIFGCLGIGRFIKLMPQPVVSGFMTGIGVIIIILQISPLFGQNAPDGTIFIKLAALPTQLMQLNSSAVALGTVTLVIMYFTPQSVRRLVPPPLIAIAVGSVVASQLSLQTPVIGNIPSGLPQFVPPQLPLNEIHDIIRYALVLAFLGAIDSLLTSLVADSVTRTSHNSNRELIGQGIGNMVSGFFGGLPCAGATMRTLVNVRAGGKTPLSGAFHSIVLLLIVLGFSGLASQIPLAVLAGILVKVGTDIVDWQALKRIRTAPKPGVAVMLVTLSLTVFVDLITAVAAGFVMASVLFVSRTAKAQVESAHFSFGTEQNSNLTDEENQILEQSNGRIVMFHVEGPLSFGSARDIGKMIQRDIEKDVLLIDMTGIPFIDSSAAAALEEVIIRLNEIDDKVIIFGVREAVMATMFKTGVAELLGKENILENRIAALKYAQQQLKA